jgi:hypothetical protein
MVALYQIMFPDIPTSQLPPEQPPTPVPSPAQTSMTVPVESTATATLEPTLTASPAPSVPSNIMFFDDFETIPGVWKVGELTNEYTTENIKIANGKFVWDITSTKPTFRKEYPEAPIVSDFELQAEMRLVSGSETTAYGLAFRGTEAGVYVFYIVNRGSFMLGYRVEDSDQWTYPIAWIAEPAIQKNSSNILKVVAKGSSIQLFINDKIVGSITDSNANSGKTGISLVLYEMGDQAVLEVDNYSLAALKD